MRPRLRCSAPSTNPAAIRYHSRHACRGDEPSLALAPTLPGRNCPLADGGDLDETPATNPHANRTAHPSCLPEPVA